MRRQIKVKVRRGDKLVTEEATLWINEIPPEYQRGKNKKGKTRHGKQKAQALIVEEAQNKRERERDGTS